VGVISLGIVCILMVGEIDLSVGSVSGLASALLGMAWVNQGWPVWLTVPAVVLVGGLIGWVYSQLFNRFGILMRCPTSSRRSPASSCWSPACGA
jgi:D-xylose transport system permease protein